MCGICGFNWKDEKEIEEMNETLIHRGPDFQGLYTDQNLSLGHVRLAIRDLSEKGKQPMGLKDNEYVIVYNGEVYNFRELRKDLINKGYKFKSETDTEVVLNLYREYGCEAFKKINGIFAFVIYDKRENDIILCRDFLGIKPLYFYSKNNKFIFSSEIKTFLDLNLELTLDDISILEYLQSKNINRESFFREVTSLKPGYYLIYNLKNKKMKEHNKYLDLYDFIDKRKYLKNKNRSEKELIEELDKLLNEVVRDQMISDVEVGSICSGGVDSSLITAIAAKYNKTIKIFNVDVVSDSEMPYAGLVAKHLSLELKSIKFGREEFLKNYKNALYYNDLPFTHPNSVGIYALSKFIKENEIKVILSGEGADEVFGGYDKYKSLYKLFFLKNKLNFEKFHKLALLFLGEESIFDLASTEVFPNSKYKTNISYINRSDVVKELKHKLDFVNNKLEKQLNIFILKDLKEYIVPLLRRSDRMSMAFGIELRVPFLDKRMIKFAMNLPLKYKVNFWDSKYLLKKVAEKYLPKEVVYRKKMGFPLPLDRWLTVKRDEEKVLFLKEWFKINDIKNGFFKSWCLNDKK